MALDFPNSPALNQTFSAAGRTWMYDGAKWVLQQGIIDQLDDIGDVVITAPEEFQSLVFDGTNWINKHASTVTYVRNAESTTLTTGTVVYLFGATGDHATVKRADNNSDTTSSKTVGIIAANIPASENGPVVTRGYVDGIDLSVGYSEGDVLWLGENGAFTTTKPTAPDHLVFVGVVVRATSNGIVYVATQNGYELDELHNVSLPSPQAGQSLVYDGSLWVSQQLIPAGVIQMFAPNVMSAPVGWLMCDGSAVSRTSFAALFSAIGTTYGSGDGSTTFNLPNLSGRVPVGRDFGQTEFDTIGETGGSKTHTLTVDEMPSHTHIQNSHQHSVVAYGSLSGTYDRIMTDYVGGGSNTVAVPQLVGGIALAGGEFYADSTTATNQNTGGGLAHNNLQPYIVLNYIIKA